MILELEDVKKTYQNGTNSVDAFNGINLKIKNLSSNLILGPSGAGKSTLISISSLLIPPSSGEVRIKDMYTSILTLKESSYLRRLEIGVIHQRDNLFPFLNMVENVQVPQISGNKDEAADLLQNIGFNKINRCPGDISMLDQQKVALARALINKPSIMLADEPTGELNSTETHEYMDLLISMSAESVLLMVSNNKELKEYFDVVYYLKEGNLVKNTGE
jgi:ABC-type lipoprotein export system ATPase subunit